MKKIAAAAFMDEVTKIAHVLDVPVHKICMSDVENLLEDPFFKVAAPRAVKEWRAATAAGDTAGADSIAKGYAGAGLKPRYLEDVSLGGAEAGVDRMMGDVRHSTGALEAPDAVSPRRELHGRLDQMKANKAGLGLEGRAPTPSVKSSPEGRAALLRGTQPAPAASAAPNESGYVARKMYKPDSFISQGEFTPQHVQQKMEMTQAARGLSPEAKAMVPDMYGMKTMGSGPTQRTQSFHEYVPGMQDLRGHNIGNADKPVFSKMPQASKDISAVKENVIAPLRQHGMLMGDVTGERGTNWGNVARAGDGTAKVVDFLPAIAGRGSPAAQSFAKYAPMPTLRHSTEGGGNLADLRKEQYKPTMESRPAAPEQVQRALAAHDAAAGAATAPPAARPATAPTPQRSAQVPSAAMASTPSPVSVVAPTRPAAPLAQAATAPARPAPGGIGAPAATRPATPAAAGMRPAATGAATPGALRAPAAPRMGTPAPHLSLPTKPAMRGLHL